MRRFGHSLLSRLTRNCAVADEAAGSRNQVLDGSEVAVAETSQARHRVVNIVCAQEAGDGDRGSRRDARMEARVLGVVRGGGKKWQPGRIALGKVVAVGLSGRNGG